MASAQYPLRVLLVDDETEFLAATAKALRRRGFHPETADNGLRALDLLEQRPFDIVVLDVKMPGIDGEQVFYEIQRRWSELPVVMLTGHGTVQQAFNMSRDGLHDYLPKPCDVEDLAALLRKAARPTASDSTAVPDAILPVRILHVHGVSLASKELTSHLQEGGARVHSATNATDALGVLRGQNVDVVLVDLTSLTLRASEFVRVVHHRQHFTEVILKVNHQSLQQGIEALRAGAYDVLTEAASVPEVEGRIRRAHARREKRSAAEIEKQVREIIARNPN